MARELRALITLAGKIDPSLQMAMIKASGESIKLARNVEKSAKSMSRVAEIAKGSFLGLSAYGILSGITSRITAFAGESLKLASDLTEVQNVVDVTFGKSAELINIWSKTALSAYGLSELQAKQYSGTMGAMLKSSGIAQKDIVVMSEKLAGLAGDFASFYNLQHEDAWEKIRSGISGETEPLKQLGINMSVANLQAYALSEGIQTSYNDMDQAAQSLLRYNYLMDVSKDAQGDFARTQGSYANQVRLFQTNLDQLGASIAVNVLPQLTPLIQKANNFIQNGNMAGVAEKGSYWFGVMGNSIKFVYDHSNILIPVLSDAVFTITAFKVVGTVTHLMDLWKASTFAITFAQKGLNAALRANPIGLVITAIGLLVGAGVYLYRNWDTVSMKAMKMWVNLKNYFAEGANYLINKVNLLIDGFNRITGLNVGKIGLIAYDTSLNSMGGFRELEAQGVTAAPTIPQFALGGIATHAAIFGEAGPEMAIPLQRSQRSINLLNQTADILGVRGDKPQINITYSPIINGNSIPEVQRALDISFEQFRDWVDRVFEDKVRVSFG